MRKPKYLSPTSYQMFWKDREEFYLRYLADNPPPRLPQTHPMSVGSAFDAYIKSFLHEHLGGKDPRFVFETLFNAQVDEANRPFALEAGLTCFEAYTVSGALSDLMLELSLASEPAQFELTIEGRLAHESTINGIPLLGKPDIYFKTRCGTNVILDWKVNGYCAQRATSPTPGYIMVSDGWEDSVAPHTPSHRCGHKDARVAMVAGMELNYATTLEQQNQEWAEQISMYLWLLGEPVGTQAVAGIDQLVGHSTLPDGTRLLRIARHRACINAEWQMELFRKLGFVWNCVQSGNIFFEMTKEQAADKMRELDIRHQAYPQNADPAEKWFESITRQYRNF